MAPRHPSGEFDSLWPRASACYSPRAIRFGTAGLRETSSTMPEPEKFAVLSAARRIWAISPVHGDMARLRALHGYVAERLQAGDRLVYFGGKMGRRGDVGRVSDGQDG